MSRDVSDGEERDESHWSSGENVRKRSWRAAGIREAAHESKRWSDRLVILSPSSVSVTSVSEGPRGHSAIQRQSLKRKSDGEECVQPQKKSQGCVSPGGLDGHGPCGTTSSDLSSYVSPDPSTSPGDLGPLNLPNSVISDQVRLTLGERRAPSGNRIQRIQNNNLNTAVMEGKGSMPIEVALMIRVNSDPICPNILHLIEWFETATQYIMILERLDPCQDLDDYCYEQGNLEENQARTVLVQLIGALKHCQKMGEVHRDVKPQNTNDIKLLVFRHSDLLSSRVVPPQPLPCWAGHCLVSGSDTFLIVVRQAPIQ